MLFAQVSYGARWLRDCIPDGTRIKKTIKSDQARRFGHSVQSGVTQFRCESMFLGMFFGTRCTLLMETNGGRYGLRVSPHT